MIKVVHDSGNNFTSDAIKSLIKNNTNKIKIILDTDDYQQTAIEISRDIYIRGCSCEELTEASKNRSPELTIRISTYLFNLLEIKENTSVLKKFLMYIATGKIEFGSSELLLVFLLAGSFKIHPFFHSLIDSNINLQQNQAKETIKQMLNYSLKDFGDFLIEEGKYNFVWYILSKLVKKNNLKDLVNRYISEDKHEIKKFMIERFMIEYIAYKVYVKDVVCDDILHMYEIYHQMFGYSEEVAKQTIKSRIRWSEVPVIILENHRLYLKFTEEEMRKLLHERLTNLMEGVGGVMQQEILQLRQRRDELKAKYNEIFAKEGALKMKLELKNCGISQPSQIRQQSSMPYVAPSDNYSQISCIDNPKPNSKPNNSENTNTYKSQYQGYSNTNVCHEGNFINNEEAELESAISDMLKSGYKPRSSLSKPSQVANQKSSHIPEYASSCKCKREFQTSCGCMVCHECTKIRYMQKSGNYEAIDQPGFQIPPEHAYKYNICCYKCDKKIDQSDLCLYNSMI